MKLFFKELFEYSHHANQALAVVFTTEFEKTTDKANLLYCHLLNAHQIWNNRIISLHPLHGVWDVHPPEKRAAIDSENHHHSLKILAEIDLLTNLSYANSRQKFNNSIQDILFHVINHATYHRGQIAAEFRNGGIEPIATDYILFKR